MKERDIESFIVNSSPRKKRVQPDLVENNINVGRSISHRSVFSKDLNAKKIGARMKRNSTLATKSTGADMYASSGTKLSKVNDIAPSKSSDVNGRIGKTSKWNGDQQTKKTLKKASRLTTSIEMASVPVLCMYAKARDNAVTASKAIAA